MRPWALFGGVLMAIGLVILVVGHFSFTTEKPVATVGPLTASVTENHNIAFPQMAGFGFILVGGVLVFLGRRSA